MKPLSEHNGFTMIEVVVVLMIITLLAVVAVTRVVQVGEAGTVAEEAALKAHLRYAQGRAMANDSAWGIQFHSSDRYWLFEADASQRRAIPGESGDVIVLSSLSIHGTPLAVVFDGYGSPGDSHIAISTSGSGITVTANTGYIP